jgi:NB-ARC domain
MVLPPLLRLNTQTRFQIRATFTQRYTNALILGFLPGGMGKTTLARRVFDDMVRDYRGAAAFVEVGEKGDTQQALQALLQSLGVQNSGTGTLRAQLHQVLSGKPSALLVLDNLWTPEHLSDIIAEVPTGTRVIVTARDVAVLEGRSGMLFKDSIFPMPVLSESASLQLFRHHSVIQNFIGWDLAQRELAEMPVSKLGSHACARKVFVVYISTKGSMHL